MRSIIRFLLLLGLVFLSFTTIVQACTGIQVQATDGSITFARSLDFGIPIKSNLLFAPRGQNWISPAPYGADGMTWQNKYAFMGPNGFEEKLFIGGMNEKGLYIGAFWFPRIAQYQKATDEETAKIIAPRMFGALILGTCGTLEEVRAKIATVKLVGVSYDKLDMVLPLHWVVVDSKGKSIVIEPINGEIVVQENPVGVFTNSPQFSWHLQNLSNYINLTSANCDSKKIRDFTANPVGEGAGMLGLPGDFTPPSRFVRAALFSSAATPVKTAAEAVNQAFLLIGNVTIAQGLVHTIEPDGSSSVDYTQWTAVYDLSNRKCYFRTYENQDVRMVNFDQLLKDNKAILTIPMWETKPQYQDITGKAK